MTTDVIDVHTHMLSEEWMSLLAAHGGPTYELRTSPEGKRVVYREGAQFFNITPGMFDYDLRISAMDAAKVDIAIVSLTAPNAHFGAPEIALKAATVMNDSMAEAQVAYPDRIRWFASLPWLHADLAIAELERACAAGAVGVMVIANIEGRPLTAPEFAPIWKAIDDRKLPVLVHPTLPPGAAALGLDEYYLGPSIGFTFDTSLAIARCIHDGFLDRYPNLKLIASHGAGALPYLIGRLDICWKASEEARSKTRIPPSEYMRRIYADAVVFTDDALKTALRTCGPDNILYGSDYPHQIGDMAGCLARVNTLPPRTCAKVRSVNARKIFNI